MRELTAADLSPDGAECGYFPAPAPTPRQWTAAMVAADFDRPEDGELLTQEERDALWRSVGHDPRAFGHVYATALQARRDRRADPPREAPAFAGRSGFASYASAFVERAEALDEALNSGPPCHDPMIGGTYYAGACLERARRTFGRRPHRWNVEDMCAACAASHLATLCASRLRDAARAEREDFARVADAAARDGAWIAGDGPLRPNPLHLARRLRTLRAQYLGSQGWDGRDLSSERAAFGPHLWGAR